MNDQPKHAFGVYEWAEDKRNYADGCKNGCIYGYCCLYAWKFAKRAGKPIDPNKWTDMTIHLRKSSLPANKRVMFPTMHDIFLEHFDTFIDLLNKLLLKGNTVLVVSKPRLEVIEKTIARIRQWQPEWQDRVEFRFTITTIDPAIAKTYEPGAPSPAERIACLKLAYERGFKTSVSIEPYLSDPLPTYDAVLPYVTGDVWVGASNHIPQLVHMWTEAKNETNVRLISALIPLYSVSTMRDIFDRLRPLHRRKFKDSFREALGIDQDGNKLKGVSDAA